MILFFKITKESLSAPEAVPLPANKRFDASKF
jgi:hypothetical protein